MAAGEEFNRTLLVVMGDHGMTNHGDHGGGTPEETDSFIFVHHPRAAAAAAAGGDGAGLGGKKKASPNEKAGRRRGGRVEFEVMPQINFAPTLSLILGLPIPFGSLGTVPRRFWEVANAWDLLPGWRGRPAGGSTENTVVGGKKDVKKEVEEQYAKVLEVTAAQVWRYLQQYARAAGNPFTAADWSLLTGLYASATSAEDEISDGENEKTKRFARFLSKTAEVAREQWVQFGEEKMAAGLTLLILNLALHVSVLWFCFCARHPAAAASIAKEGEDGKLAAATKGHWKIFAAVRRAQILEAAGALSLMVLGFACRLSNSFIVAEGDAVHFFLASFGVLFLVRSLSCAGDGGPVHYGQTVSGATAAVGLLLCNAGLQQLGASWVKEGSLDDGRDGGKGAPSSDSHEFPAVLVLGALATLPWVCHRALAPAMGGGGEGLRVTVAVALTAIALRTLATGAGADAFRRAAGRAAAETLDAAAGGFLPWWGCTR
jgi:phosphatidylinositol glycan class O